MNRSCLIPIGLTLALAGTALAQPANDNCANAIPVANGSATVFDMTGATRDGVASCGNFAEAVDVWFSYTSPGSERLFLDLCGSPNTSGQTAQRTVAVYATCGGAELGCNRGDFCDTASTPQLVVDLTAAGTYRISVSCFNNIAFNDAKLGVLNLRTTPLLPPNDVCSGALPIVDGNNYVNNIGATRDTPCPCTKGGSSNAGTDVWYSYTAPQTGIRNFTITRFNRRTGATGDSLLAIYDSCGGALLACDDDSNSAGLSKIYHFPVTAGSTYLVQLANYQNSANRQGLGVLNISAPPSPMPLDDCSLATPVAGEVTVPFTTVGLTDSDRQIWDCRSWRDGWYAWTPSQSGVGVVEGCDAGGVNNFNGLLLSVYDACGTVPLTCAQGPDDSPAAFCQPKVCFDVSAGRTYYVRFGVLFTWQQVSGDMHFSVRPPNAGISVPPNALNVEPGRCDDAPASDLDGGCNVSPNLFVPISLCGTYQGTASSRLEPFFPSTPEYYTVDTDWYVFTLTSPDSITFIGESEFPPNGGVRTNSCAASNIQSIIFAIRNCTGVYSLNFHTPVLAAGTYYFWVSPQQSAGTADSSCGFNDRYWFTIQPDSGGCTGACCTGTTCAITTQVACTSGYKGDGSVCSPAACCPADFNGSGAISVQDIFDFLGAYFSSDPRADFNNSGAISVQDIFDFLAAYFTGC